MLNFVKLAIFKIRLKQYFLKENSLILKFHLRVIFFSDQSVDIHSVLERLDDRIFGVAQNDRETDACLLGVEIVGEFLKIHFLGKGSKIKQFFPLVKSSKFSKSK